MDKTIARLEKKIHKLEGQIRDCEEAIRLLQEVCTHENIVGEYFSDTGNWDKMNDDYWIDATCTDCNMKFHASLKQDKWLYEELSEKISR